MLVAIRLTDDLDAMTAKYSWRSCARPRRSAAHGSAVQPSMTLLGSRS
jgi:hypothetical protein